jgi:hypothetical protein
MTALELKVANKQHVHNRSEHKKDEDRFQKIIHDIMAKKNSPGNIEETRDETELVINLEAAHDKIHAILNRVAATSSSCLEEEDAAAACYT